MTAPTHRLFGISFAMLVSMFLYKNSITSVWYYLCLIIMLATAKYGALFPDLDHAWANVKEKTVPNLIINKAIHITGGVHRSWQTHSIDIATIFSVMCWVGPKILLEHSLISQVNMEVLSLVLIGFCSGWISHLFSDMLSSAGVRLFCWSKFTIRLVPKKLFNFRFNTGHEWESFVYAVTKRINLVIGFICVVYPIITDQRFITMVESIVQKIQAML